MASRKSGGSKGGRVKGMTLLSKGSSKGGAKKVTGKLKSDMVRSQRV